MRPAFTKTKFIELQKEFERLLTDRKAAVVDLKKARDMGDLSENGYYKSARFKLSDIDRRLRQLKYFLTKGVVIEQSQTDIIGLGSTVTLKSEDKEITYTIVGSYEANPREGKISDESPLGRILLNKKKGDKIEFNGRSHLVDKVT